MCDKGNQSNRSNRDLAGDGQLGYQSESPKRTPQDGRRNAYAGKHSQYGSPYSRPDYTSIGRAPDIQLEGKQLEAEIKRVLALVENNTAE